MEHQEPDRAIVYQRKMQALYNRAAADIFKQQYSPADPFDGVLIDAAFLEISELVNIFKAAKAFEDEGNAAFVENLIHNRGRWTTPAVRVNQLWLDALRQRKREVCEYIHNCLFEGEAEMEEQRQHIVDMGEPQLLEYLRQAQESLAFEVEVVVDGES